MTIPLSYMTLPASPPWVFEAMTLTTLDSLEYMPRQHWTSEETNILLDFLLERQTIEALDSSSMPNSAIYAKFQKSTEECTR